jgi:hypothetical protein
MAPIIIQLFKEFHSWEINRKLDNVDISIILCGMIGSVVHSNLSSIHKGTRYSMACVNVM